MKNEKVSKPTGGKRSLYNPALGASNYRKAQEGPFADKPAFIAMKGLAGVGRALQKMATMSDQKTLALIATAVAGQMDRAWFKLSEAAIAATTPGDKLRFAEAVIRIFVPGKEPDEKTARACWLAIQLTNFRRGKRAKPSQAELRKALIARFGMTFEDEEWKRMLKKTGLNKQLPTALQKRRGDALPKVSGT